MENVAGEQGDVKLKKCLHRSLSTFKCLHFWKSGVRYLRALLHCIRLFTFLGPKKKD